MAAASSVHNQDVMISLVWVKAHQRAAPTHVGVPQVDASTSEPLSQRGGFRRPTRHRPIAGGAHHIATRSSLLRGRTKIYHSASPGTGSAKPYTYEVCAQAEFALRLSVEDLMAGEAILIVDDNPANLKLTSYLLTSRGYQVRTALDASEALEALEVSRPRLILMDIQLPGMDGLALTRALKSAPTTKDILIVAVTAFAMKGDDQKALAAGCDGYITKPIDTRELPGVLAALLAKAESRGA
jgi:two-component system, cell cycle response regulator DivK